MDMSAHFDKLLEALCEVCCIMPEEGLCLQYVHCFTHVHTAENVLGEEEKISTKIP